MRDQLTKNDIKKIEEEIEYRKLVVRKEAIEAVKEARAQGDLSENFEYYAAKKDKNKNESRIRYLERMLRTAVVVSDESKEDEVGINNTVTLYIEEDDETETYKLVTSIRGNSLEGKISTESPLGKAILGKKQGDRVLVRVNDNYGYYVVIKAIDKSTNDAEDDIRKFLQKVGANRQWKRQKRIIWKRWISDILMTWRKSWSGFAAIPSWVTGRPVRWQSGRQDNFWHGKWSASDFLMYPVTVSTWMPGSLNGRN